MKPHTEQTIKLEQLYKAVSESELNSWSNISVGWGVGTEFSDCGFKSQSGQAYIYIYIYIYMQNK